MSTFERGIIYQKLFCFTVVMKTVNQIHDFIKNYDKIYNFIQKYQFR